MSGQARPTPRTDAVCGYINGRGEFVVHREYARFTPTSFARELEIESDARAERIEFLIHEVNALQDEIAQQEAENTKLREALEYIASREGQSAFHVHDMRSAARQALAGKETPPYSCKFCGRPSWVDPSDQAPPPDYCHDEDHGKEGA